MDHDRTHLLTVVAELQARPGKEEDLRRAVLALIEPTRNEKGCAQYDLHVHTSHPGRFVFYENWSSREDLDHHAASAHLKNFGAISADLLTEPPRVETYWRIA